MRPASPVHARLRGALTAVTGGESQHDQRHNDRDDGHPVAGAQAHAKHRDTEHGGDNKICADDRL